MNTQISKLNRQPLIIRFLPILNWLPKYERAWLRGDILAGLTVLALLIPEGMAYAGSPGLLPSGKAAAASGMGSPHHGGAARARLVEGNADGPAAGLARAPTGEINNDAINSSENKRSMVN